MVKLGALFRSGLSAQPLKNRTHVAQSLCDRADIRLVVRASALDSVGLSEVETQPTIKTLVIVVDL